MQLLDIEEFELWFNRPITFKKIITSFTRPIYPIILRFRFRIEDGEKNLDLEPLSP